ncbi:hypothetical protein HY623_00410 [Candidatus Uhrbacteria bacterium]|nr:hypothetical protein [Candidatus Uhrbacteria bacterium]
MKHIDYKKILSHAALILGALVVIAGLMMWVRSEEAYARDAQRMGDVIDIKLGLYRYYLRHAAYPSSATSVLLGGPDADCLGDKGFVSRKGLDCSGRPYLSPVPASLGLTDQDVYTYTPLGADSDTICDSATGCPRYGILFYFETNVFAKKGFHVLTPEGLQTL